MIQTILKTSMVLLAVLVGGRSLAGYYTSIDTREEIPWDRDFNAFNGHLNRLASIAATDDRAVDSPMRQRYLLIDALGRDGTANLKTWQQKLNYSAVLIRRGKAYEATPILKPLSAEYPDNFLVWTQLASAYFLSGNPEFQGNALDCMKQALELWPEDMEKLDPDVRKFVEKSQLYGDLDRFREIEIYFQRLMRNRLKEAQLARQKKPVPDAVDPIFLDMDSQKKLPVSFLTEAGKFEVGRIAAAEKAKLPKQAVEYVEQLLIWMPGDQRLLWLMGEVMNASVMELKEGDDRNDLIRSTHQIFKKLDSFENPPSFAPALKGREKLLADVAGALPERRMLDPVKIEDKLPPADPALSQGEWWRTLGVGMLTGLAIGMFAVWQLQEMRRRRQARASA